VLFGALWFDVPIRPVEVAGRLPGSSLGIQIAMGPFLGIQCAEDPHLFWYGGGGLPADCWARGEVDGPRDPGAKQRGRTGVHAPAHSTPELPTPADLPPGFLFYTSQGRSHRKYNLTCSLWKDSGSKLNCVSLIVEPWALRCQTPYA
jgi:hypothetical protein